MRILSVGGGPAGLYLAILMKKFDPDYEITVVERNKIDDTFGFGVVFSDATMDNLATADRESYDAICRAFYHWDDIDILYRGKILRSTGHGFAGMSRQRLLEILAHRAAELGVELRFEQEVSHPDELGPADLILAADGVNSRLRDLYADRFGPRVDLRPNRFVWLGTTRPYPAFTFDFRENEHGLWRLHAYQYERPSGGDTPISTFIVEATEDAFENSGLDPLDEKAAVAYCGSLFAEHLEGHRLTANRSIWRRFPTISNDRWHRGNVVLIGDAAHTAHFSVGSGTKLALEDAIALAAELQIVDPDNPRGIQRALSAYEANRRADVESLQRAAQVSLQWFEDTERYMHMEPIQFGFTLLTRSLRITHEDLQSRDPGYVAQVDRWFARRAAEQSGVPIEGMVELPRREALAVHSPARSYASTSTPPPMFTPFKLRDLLIVNRVVVSAMCQYSARDGLPNDWHFVHLGSRAIGGAGLVMTEMTDVSADGRITPGCAGLYSDEQAAAWQRTVEFVHGNSAARIGVQLAHAGRKGSTKLAWEGIDEPLGEDGWPLIAASAVPWGADSATPREMTREDMDSVRDDFVAATKRAVTAGFDVVELHMAHGYLLSTFISPLTNQRADDYGGSLDGRMRYPLEVLDAVRAAWPEDKPLFVRISAVDWAPGGLTPDDAVEIARMLAEHGCDLVDVSAGQTVPEAAPAYGRQFQTPFSDRIRNEVGIATMAVGNISSYMDVNTILAAGRADLCALGRAHLWDPYWTRNAAQKQGYPLAWPDPYSVLDGYRPRFE
jgi:anthraniloyl-CoA monooxygenase